MIPLNFGLFWSGSKLSYLRYLTFKTLRHFHPHSRIQLYVSDKFSISKDGTDQDYKNPNNIKKDYMSELEKLNVEIIKFNKHSDLAPNHQSDIFRWTWLKENSGFYLDTDQIILKSFKTLPLMASFIYSCYKIDSPFVPNGEFAPVGVLGAEKGAKIVDLICNKIMKYYNKNDYNSIGPWMMMKIIKNIDLSRTFNAPPIYFYPAPICDRMKNIFDGKMKFKKESYAAYWFGGHIPSSKFNRNYTEEFAKTSNDTISVFLRSKRLI